jgi:hypothetical protein
MLTLLLVSALAGDPANPPFDTTVSSLELAPPRPPSRADRTVRVGQALTFAGLSVMGLGSTVMMVGVASPSACEFECYGDLFALAGGGAVALLGLPFVVAGGATWGVGRRHQRLLVTPTVQAEGAGAAVVVSW